MHDYSADIQAAAAEASQSAQNALRAHLAYPKFSRDIRYAPQLRFPPEFMEASGDGELYAWTQVRNLHTTFASELC